MSIGALNTVAARLARRAFDRASDGYCSHSVSEREVWKGAWVGCLVGCCRHSRTACMNVPDSHSQGGTAYVWKL